MLFQKKKEEEKTKYISQLYIFTKSISYQFCNVFKILKLSNHPTSNVYQRQWGFNLFDSIDSMFFWLCAVYSMQ